MRLGLARSSDVRPSRPRIRHCISRRGAYLYDAYAASHQRRAVMQRFGKTGMFRTCPLPRCLFRQCRKDRPDDYPFPCHRQKASSAMILQAIYFALSCCRAPDLPRCYRSHNDMILYRRHFCGMRRLGCLHSIVCSIRIPYLHPLPLHLIDLDRCRPAYSSKESSRCQRTSECATATALTLDHHLINITGAE